MRTPASRPVSHRSREPPIPIRSLRKTLSAVLFVVALLTLSCAADKAGDTVYARAEEAPTSIELAQGWTLQSDREVAAGGADISRPGFPDAGWHTVARMPATVLSALQDDGTYPDLYFGDNLATEVPADLYRQDWWYRTTFTAPAGHSTYLLEFPGINYRAEVWLNGHLLAGSADIAGMFVAHEIDAGHWIRPGAPNVLAVKVTPEQALQDVDGVELADSWYDWINWDYLGYQGPDKNPANGNSFVPDRNAGIWKPVTLTMSGPAVLRGAAVDTELPRSDTARLTVRSLIANATPARLRGTVRATITRQGKPTVDVEQQVTLSPGQRSEIVFSPGAFRDLTVYNPDLWWPYTLGRPDLYDLRVDFVVAGRVLASTSTRFGIRTVSQHRDDDETFPYLGTGGSFYLTVNGRDFPVRGAAYTPDLLLRYDPARDDAILHYAKDLGLNMLRLEGKFPGEHFAEEADELGIPLMYGWMCCNQWEKWAQWDAEDNRIARQSLNSQILELRSHPSAFVWANGSDGKPPPAVLADYHAILENLHWPNAVVDTVSSLARDPDGNPDWDGIHMAGPYSWRPPSYWFSGRYGATRGATAEQGDNEHIPPLASLERFIPPDKLWPINEAWYFHAGSDANNSKLAGIRRAVDRRYGPSADAAEFAAKAQLAHYESTRAQFESFAAGGWDNHKMTIYWMLDNHWPSFFGNLFDYYLRPGGAYYGAKTGLRPLSAVFDSYAKGDHSTAAVTVVNQSPRARYDLQVRVRTYDLWGRLRDDRRASVERVAAGGSAGVLVLPRQAPDSPVFFVRVELSDGAGVPLSENVYWQSQRPDDLGTPGDDNPFEVWQASWADMTALNTMPVTALQVSAQGSGSDVAVTLHNPSPRIAFFERVEVTATRDGAEILPVEYSDNYVTVFPGESVTLTAHTATPGPAPQWVRVSGYDTAPTAVAVQPGTARSPIAAQGG